MQDQTRLLAALVAVLALAVAPARADEPRSTVGLRLGVAQPTGTTLGSSAWRAGPAITLVSTRALAPWLELEAAAGWGRSALPTVTALVLPLGTTSGPLVTVTDRASLDLVPLTAGARLRWPSGAVQPYLVGSGGLLFARNQHTGSAVQGWGPTVRAGAGVDWDRGERLILGLEGAWGWGYADLRPVGGSSAPVAESRMARAGPLRTGGLQLQASLGWRLQPPQRTPSASPA